MSNETTVRVLGVLAGAYRGRIDADRHMVTHAVRESEMADGKTLCRRLGVDRLSDQYGGEEAGTLPTCPPCLERAVKLGATVLGPYD